MKLLVSIYKVASINKHHKFRMLISNLKTQCNESIGLRRTSGPVIGTCKTRTDMGKEMKITSPFRLTISLSTLKMKYGSPMQFPTPILKCKQISPLSSMMKQMIKSCVLKFYAIH